MTSSELYAAIQATISDSMNSFEDASRQADPTLLSRACTPDCTRQLVPAGFLISIGMDPNAMMSNAGYEAHMAGELQLIESATCDILETVIDVTVPKAVARVAHHIKLHGKESACLEFCWFLYFTADGGKITKVVEFVDTTECLKQVERLKEVAAELASKKA